MVYYFHRANETNEETEKRRKADNDARKEKLKEMSPESKRKHREKDRLRKEKQRDEQRKRSIPKIKVVVKNQITDSIQANVEEPAPIIQEPKLSEYEQIRQRNIEERENLFQKMKIPELKAQVAVGIPKDNASV